MLQLQQVGLDLQASGPEGSGFTADHAQSLFSLHLDALQIAFGGELLRLCLDLVLNRLVEFRREVLIDGGQGLNDHAVALELQRKGSRIF